MSAPMAGKSCLVFSSVNFKHIHNVLGRTLELPLLSYTSINAKMAFCKRNITHGSTKSTKYCNIAHGIHIGSNNNNTFTNVNKQPASHCFCTGNIADNFNTSKQRHKLVLGIETSCDDTGAAVVDDEGNILGESIHNQTSVHVE